ncbi:MAG: hypothetical protein WC043_09255 [Pseudobdellovibrionaceae bacterium]
MRYLFIPLCLCALLWSLSAYAAVPAIPFTVTMSEAVNVTGSPRIVLDVDGNTRYAVYAAGTGTASLTFTYTATAGDVDLNGIGIGSSSVDLNGGTVTDLNGNPLANLTFTAPANMASVNVNYPSLSMDFIADADGRYTLNGTVYNDLTSFLTATGGTFTRASTATYFDSTGTLQTAASGAPRFDYDPVTHAAKGLLIEGGRTNYIYNSTMQGAVAGSPGTAPTHWQLCSVGGGATCTRTIVGTGTESGMTYLQVRFQGTMPASGAYTNIISFDSYGHTITATNAQPYNAQVYLSLMSGTLPTNVGFIASEYTGSTYLANRSFTTVTPASLTSSLARYSGTAGAVNSSIDNLREPRLVMGGTGVLYNYDFTLRVAAPQFELGAFASSFIPTTNAPGARADDLVTFPTGVWHSNGVGTAISETNHFYVYHVLNGASGMFDLDDGTATNAIVARLDVGKTVYVRNSNATVASFGLGAFSVNTVLRSGVAYSLNNVNAAGNGTLNTLDTSAIIPTFTTLRLGIDRGGTFGTMFGYMRKFYYYPVRASDTQLQLLTQ